MARSRAKVSYNSKFEKKLQSMKVEEIVTAVTMVTYFRKNADHPALSVLTKTNRNKTKLEISKAKDDSIILIAVTEDDQIKFCDVKLQ